MTSHVFMSMFLLYVQKGGISAQIIDAGVGSGTIGNGLRETIHLILEPVTWVNAKTTCEANNWLLYTYTTCLGCDVIQQRMAHWAEQENMTYIYPDFWFGAVAPQGGSGWVKYLGCAPLDIGVANTNHGATSDECAAFDIADSTVSLSSLDCDAELPFVCVETLAATCDFTTHDVILGANESTSSGQVASYSNDNRGSCKGSCLIDPYCLGITHDRDSVNQCLHILKPLNVSIYNVTLTPYSGTNVVTFVKRCKTVVETQVNVTTDSLEPIGCYTTTTSSTTTTTTTTAPTTTTTTVSTTTSTTVSTTTNPATQPTTTSVTTTTLTTTTSAPDNTTVCVCFNGTALTDQQVAELAASFTTAKAMDPDDTGTGNRRKTSSMDLRGSAIAIGTFAIICSCVLFGFILVTDLSPMYQMLMSNIHLQPQAAPPGDS